MPFADIENQSTGIIPIGPESIIAVDNEDDSMKLSTIHVEPSRNALRYCQSLENIPPQEIIVKFAQSAPLNVQEATKSTIVNLIGNFPNYSLDAALVTTSVKLASLLYQMQITGYLFKSAEYVMSTTKTLKGLPKLPFSFNNDNSTGVFPSQSIDSLLGNITVKTVNGDTVSVNVHEITSSLRSEINELRNELLTIKNQRESELTSNLLTYIQALPTQELSKLTSDISGDIVQAIQLLVGSVMEKAGIDANNPEHVFEQNLANLAHLCTWQIIIGYRLREIEAFEKGFTVE
jgi:hypothetical protein